MKCPNDDTVLIMSERQGIEIDYCPTCRGVWLDRGELDKIIDRSSADTPPRHQPQLAQQPYEAQSQKTYHDKSDDYQHSRPYHKKKKRESFLGDLFEF